MPKFTNDSKTTPMSVRYGGNTYIVPPGETLVIEEPVVEEVQTPISDSQPASSETVEAPKDSAKESKSPPAKRARGKKKEAGK